MMRIKGCKKFLFRNPEIREPRFLSNFSSLVSSSLRVFGSTEEQGRSSAIEESSPDPFERGTTEEGIVLAKHKGVEMEAAQAADDGLIAPFRSSLR